MDATTGDDFPAQENSDECFPLPQQIQQSIFLGNFDLTRNAIFRDGLPRSSGLANREEPLCGVRARPEDAALDKGSQLLEKGDTLGSIAYLEQAIAEYPEHYKAYYDLGVAHFRLAQQTEAEQAFQKAIDLTKGNFAPPQFGLSAILCQRAEFSQAVTLLQRALELEPGSAIGKYYLGWAQYGLSRLTEAEQTLEQALLRNPNLAEAYLLLTRVHMRQKNLPGALKDVETYLKINPRNEQARTLAQEIKREMAQTTTVIATAQP